MSADTFQPTEAGPEDTELVRDMLDMGRRARAASKAMATRASEDRTRALSAMANALRAGSGDILAANVQDLEGAKAKGLSPAMVDRLTLDAGRLEAIANSVDAIAALPDPIGRQLARWTVPSGLDIARVACPLGVIGIIYESRPNVTADAAALCIRSGNATILRAGSESAASAQAIAKVLRKALAETGLPEDAVQLVQTTDRAAVGHILTGLEGALNVVVPRGGKGLVARVQAEARVPVIGHLEGICHVYVHKAADRSKAPGIVVNAKLRRTGICGAAETLLIDAAYPREDKRALLDALLSEGCELRGDAAIQSLSPDIRPATEEDWATEHLAPILSVAEVDGIEGALSHIERFGTGHTESILTEDADVAERFLNAVDASIVMLNASTQFADGGEFGLGAEIGIATGRIHARGPVGADQLTTVKYVVRGTGQVRP
ncbi:MAG: glutamate-5-semialdehyde dehydrogenase [Pseudomonadota bacterium]